MTNQLLDIQNLSKAFEDEHILTQTSFFLQESKTLSILGKSGSGKTTLLKIIAGLEKQDNGTILLENNDITTLSAHKRNVVYLYQDALLFPHLNVFENIAFGLKLRKINAQEVKNRVTKMLYDLELQKHIHKMPTQLSGGQRQRVSFGRALIIQPKILLLDEPFGALDVDTRKQMQRLCKETLKQYKITTLFVTHDLKEALIMGDQIGKMQSGVLKTFKNKEEFLNDPSTGIKEEIEFWKNIHANEE
ncbi:ABC transporter ATP-binding protein [Aquimarina sp. AD10]|uniref:ABC transporter ATP-binding protein n=1 Tax=Aquimarina sp. AD10 TaxID=1714849 RepID=UPI000E47C7DF|nr:ABC transporter ATP-binding protein [Aquimarina sp. AD10]AXT62538.1 ABC transporter ATP-binding protein [Aquimarina sp. AD10]RKM90270.1 ATP-binding cassette domain-containing protein [Aquimarina sp. AD10]